mmetsp:Transcript_12384/g.30410  ORF Transcript_12384/g.30410 Transcript_12384/m.30410 type:complete len:192 (+) Transcript_12384:745-1320(+)
MYSVLRLFDEHSTTALNTIKYALSTVLLALHRDGVTDAAHYSDTCANAYRGAKAVYCNSIEVLDFVRETAGDPNAIPHFRLEQIYPYHGECICDGHFARVIAVLKAEAVRRGGIGGFEEVTSVASERGAHNTTTCAVPRSLPEPTKCKKMPGIQSYLSFNSVVSATGQRQIIAATFTVCRDLGRLTREHTT